MTDDLETTGSAARGHLVKDLTTLRFWHPYVMQMAVATVGVTAAVNDGTSDVTRAVLTVGLIVWYLGSIFTWWRAARRLAALGPFTAGWIARMHDPHVLLAHHDHYASRYDLTFDDIVDTKQQRKHIRTLEGMADRAVRLLALQGYPDECQAQAAEWIAEAEKAIARLERRAQGGRIEYEQTEQLLLHRAIRIFTDISTDSTATSNEGHA